MPASERAIELLTAAAEAAHDKKAENVLAFDVSEQLAITDAFLVASASNDRQVRAIVDAIEEKLRVDFDAKPVRREGAREGRWVLLDYLEIVDPDTLLPVSSVAQGALVAVAANFGSTRLIDNALLPPR